MELYLILSQRGAALDNLKENEKFPPPKDAEAKKMAKWIEDKVYKKITQRVNWLLDFFTIIPGSSPGFGKVSYIDLDTDYEDGCVEGRIQWNSEDGVPEVGLGGGTVCAQIPLENLIRVTNKTGSTIADGKVVRINGAQGSRPTIALASAAIHSQANATIAVATEDILNNNSGYVTTFGTVRDIDTSKGGTISDGDPVFLSATTPGEFTATKPTQPDSQVFVGVVLFANQTSGDLLVKIKPIPNLDELSDVFINSPHDLAMVTWNEANERWQADGEPWEDLRVPATNTRTTPTKTEPNFELFDATIGGVYVYKFDIDNDDDESMHFVMQMSHSYKEGSDIEPHIHWSPDTTNVGNVVWSFEYTIANVGGTFGPTVTNDITVPSGGTAFSHNIDDFPMIDGTGLTISHMLICRLTRRSTTQAADTYTGNACFLEFDFHYQKDTLGSRNETSK